MIPYITCDSRNTSLTLALKESLHVLCGIKFKYGKNTSISLGEYYEDFVQCRIQEGRYKNASEVIRPGLRLLKAEEQKFFALK